MLGSNKWSRREGSSAVPHELERVNEYVAGEDGRSSVALVHQAAVRAVGTGLRLIGEFSFISFHLCVWSYIEDLGMPYECANEIPVRPRS